MSVFTLSQDHPNDCLEAVESLAEQSMADNLDLVVFAPAESPELERLKKNFGRFRVIETAAETFGEAFAHFLKLAEAPCVTYVEEHSTVAPDWAAKILEAHDSGYPVVGFSLVNDNPESLISWVHLLGQFGHVTAPISSGKVDFLAGHHVSYARTLLERYGDELYHLLEDETAFFLRLKSQGVPLYLCGEAVSHHLHLNDLRSLLTLEFHGQRSFAATRARQPSLSLLHSFCYTLLAPLIPLVRASRLLPHAERIGLIERFSWKLAPPLAAMLCVGTVGELMGYWFGPGESATAKTTYEFERRKMVQPEVIAQEKIRPRTTRPE